MKKWLISCLHTDKLICYSLRDMEFDDWPKNPTDKYIDALYAMYRFAKVIYSNGIRFSNNRTMLVTDAETPKEAIEIFYKSLRDYEKYGPIAPCWETSRHFIHYKNEKRPKTKTLYKDKFIEEYLD